MNPQYHRQWVGRTALFPTGIDRVDALFQLRSRPPVQPLQKSRPLGLTRLSVVLRVGK